MNRLRRGGTILDYYGIERRNTNMNTNPCKDTFLDSGTS